MGYFICSLLPPPFALFTVLIKVEVSAPWHLIGYPVQVGALLLHSLPGISSPTHLAGGGVMTAPDQSHVICGEIPLLAPLFLPTECRCFGIAVRTVRSQDHLSSELVVAILAIVVKEEEVCTYGLLYCNH